MLLKRCTGSEEEEDADREETMLSTSSMSTNTRQSSSSAASMTTLFIDKIDGENTLWLNTVRTVIEEFDDLLAAF